jgi:hypothetical protein
MTSKDAQQIPHGRTIFLNEQGNDNNDGLTAETPVRTGARAVKISIKEKGTAFQVTGSHAYVKRTNSELEKR